MLYRSGIGKAMHMMQYLRPDIYQVVQDLARHMGSATKLHLDAMFRMMKYASNMNERGLTLNPTQKWDDSKDHKLLLMVEAIWTMQKTRRHERVFLVMLCIWKGLQ
jgi:hypothetical protein